MVALLTDDQPYLAEDRFEHAEEPVVLLAHPDRYALEEARRAVTIEVEPLPPVLSMKDSERIFKSYRMEKGDIDAVPPLTWPQIEVLHATGAQEQLYIEVVNETVVVATRGGRQWCGLDAVPPTTSAARRW